MKNADTHSRYWLGDNVFEFNPKFDTWDITTLLKLAQYKRSIANFVRLVTGKDIPVKFNTGKMSYTDSKTVVLSAKLEDGKFDSAVGTALHEGSHIADTNFDFTAKVHDIVKFVTQIYLNPSITTVSPIMKDKILYMFKRYYADDANVDVYLDLIDLEKLTELVRVVCDYVKRNSISMSDFSLIRLIDTRQHHVRNFVEDKRIDYKRWTKSPGYIGYYNALYNEYFKSNAVNLAVQSKRVFRTETFDSYDFRLINIVNENTDLDALKGLREIASILDLNNIGKLKSTIDSFNVAVRILIVIYSNIVGESPKSAVEPKPTPKPKKQNKKEKSEDTDENESEEQSEDEDNGGDSDEDSEGTRKSDETDEEEEDEDVLPNESDEDESGENGIPKENDEDSQTESEPDNKTGDENLDHPQGSVDEPKKDGEESDKKDEDSTKSRSGNSDDEKESDETSDGNGETDDEKESDEEDEDISKGMEKKIERDFKKQKEHVDDEDGTKDKAKMNSALETAISAVDDAGITLKTVGEGLTHILGQSISCVVVERISDTLIASNMLPIFEVDGYNSPQIIDKNIKSIQRGITLGSILGQKLQIRNEVRSLKYTRLDAGRIDKRLLHTLGYGNGKIFHRVEIDKFNKIHLHITVDLSSSMTSGKKWDNTLTCIVAICKAASVANNIHVVVSFRSTISQKTQGEVTAYTRRGRRRKQRVVKSGLTEEQQEFINTGDRPLIVVGYDSNTDKMMHIQKFWKYVYPCGYTPEGLAFESIMDIISPEVSNDVDAFCLNISDGEPFFRSPKVDYVGDVANKHTQRMIRKMRNAKVNVLSYFVYDEDDKIKYQEYHDRSVSNFKVCYEHSAKFIDVVNINEIAKTLNELFLLKH